MRSVKKSTAKKQNLHMETLETRDLLAGDVVVGGVLGLRADIDGSGTVDFADFLILSSNYEQESTPEVNGDINIDGAVDFHDFNILSHNYGRATDIPTARIQVLHNSPYASAAMVDVYLDDGLLGPLNDFAFRSATPFIDVPAGVDLKIDIAAPSSEDSSSPIFSATVQLTAGKTYIAAADGDPGVTDGALAFGLFVTDIAQESAATTGNVEALVFHGSPDAPTVDVVARDVVARDVVARDVGVIVDDIAYPSFDEAYVSVPPAEYILDITPGDANETIVASFTADLSEAADGAILVAASGFLAPPTEADPAFGLLAVFPDGTTALLPSASAPAQEARIQIVHNSPYAAAATVDLYVNDGLLLDDVSFREATSFLTVPAGVELEIDITAPNATDNSSPVFSKTVTLEDGGTYIAIADGDPEVSDGVTAFDIFVSAIGQEAAAITGNVEVLIFHGSPDAPTVDVLGLVDDISYPNFIDSYLSIPPANYVLDITPGEANETIVASFQADLVGAADAALVVAASGFLAPTESDPAFGLLAVFADGTTALLPSAVDAAMAG